jgi:hypothetical protein
MSRLESLLSRMFGPAAYGLDASARLTAFTRREFGENAARHVECRKDTTPVIKVQGRWTGLRDVKPPTRDYELRRERDDETGLAVLILFLNFGPVGCWSWPIAPIALGPALRRSKGPHEAEGPCFRCPHARRRAISVATSNFNGERRSDFLPPFNPLRFMIC